MSEYIYARVDRVIAACDIALKRMEDLRDAEVREMAETSWRRSQPSWLGRLLGAKETPLQEYVEAFVKDYDWPFGKRYGRQEDRLKLLKLVALTVQRESPGSPLVSLTREDCSDLANSWPPMPVGGTE